MRRQILSNSRNPLRSQSSSSFLRIRIPIHSYTELTSVIHSRSLGWRCNGALNLTRLTPVLCHLFSIVLLNKGLSMVKFMALYEFDNLWTQSPIWITQAPFYYPCIGNFEGSPISTSSSERQALKFRKAFDARDHVYRLWIMPSISSNQWNEVMMCFKLRHSPGMRGSLDPLNGRIMKP